MNWDEDDRYYYEQEAAKEEFIEEISIQAINDFTSDRLQSFYIKYPNVMQPALNSFLKGKKFHADGHYSAAVVFFMSAVEIFLKVTVIKPIVYGLIHNEDLADIFVQQTLSQRGFDSYNKLLRNFFHTFTNDYPSDDLLLRCNKMQAIRNKIIHEGSECIKEDSERAQEIAKSVFESIVLPIIRALNLEVSKEEETKGMIIPYRKEAHVTTVNS